MVFDLFSLLGLIVVIAGPVLVMMVIYAKYLHPLAVRISDFLTRRDR